MPLAYCYVVRWCQDIVVGVALTLPGAKAVAQKHADDTDVGASAAAAHTIVWQDHDQEKYETAASEKPTPEYGYSLYAIDRLELHP